MDLNKILVVDDNASFRQVIITMLDDTAREYVECATGSEALARYESEQPDCVLMDLEMKGLDGMEATRQLVERFPSAHVFILSQHEDTDLRTEAASVGAEGYLSKDNLPALRELLREKLNLQSQRPVGGEEPDRFKKHDHPRT